MLSQPPRSEFRDFTDKTLYESATLTAFLENCRQGCDNIYDTIIKHFGDVNDKQIAAITKYFKTFSGYMNWFGGDEGDNLLHYNVNLMFFHRRGETSVQLFVVVCIHYDNFWNDWRITAFRVMNPKTWKVIKTVYKVPGIQGDYRSIWGNHKR